MKTENHPAGSATGIDLARDVVLELMLKNNLLTQIGYRALLDGDTLDADLTYLTQLANAALARATPQHPAGLREAFDAEFLSWGGGHTKAELDLEWAPGALAGEMFRAGAAATPQHSVTEHAAAWANWKVGTDSYVPFKTRDEAEASVRRSDIAATQEGPYEAVPLFHRQSARAQPLASTAATQPEQAEEHELYDQWQHDRLFANPPQPVGPFDAWKARAALAIPASTAPTQQACTVPPSGWYCTRTPGHSGPCAAYPIQQGDQDEEKHAGANDQGATSDETDDASRIGASGRTGADQHHQHREGQSGAYGRDGREDGRGAGVSDRGEVRKAVSASTAASEQQAGAVNHGAVLYGCIEQLAGQLRAAQPNNMALDRADELLKARAALTHRATTATTAAPEPELIRAGWFLYEGIAWTPTSSDDPRATILYRKSERAAAPDIATTAADQQGEQNSSSNYSSNSGAAADQQGERCTTCDGTGDVHRADGEWLGECTCAAGVSTALERLKIAAEKTMRENEELRAALAQQGAAQAQAGALYTCKGRGGEYELIGVAYGAGTSRGTTVNLYREVSSGVMYYRTPADFADRMEQTYRAAMATPATSGGGNG